MAQWILFVDALRPATYNLERLREEARAAFGAAYVDLNEHDADLEGGRYIRCYLQAGDPRDSQLALAALVKAHDPAALTAAQQVDKRRQAAQQAYRTLAAIRGMTPDEAQAWVQANVTTVATARAALGQLAYAVVALVRYLDIED